MCGIAGWIAPPAPQHSLTTLAAMLRAIAHRGPDGEGLFVASVGGSANGAEASPRDAATSGGGNRAAADARDYSDWKVFLGHRRLAIIDPDGARQPMCDPAAGLALVFNGEIYNFRELRRELIGHGYRFARDSDTEVLLRAYQHWGDDVVRHLRGMFAFALWDGPRARLFMARDRYGEKPLYLRQGASGLHFASEIKALLAVPGMSTHVDLTSVWDYLAYRYVPGPKTLFAGIRKLMPATAAVWEAGRLREWRYWTPPDAHPRPAGPAQGDVLDAFIDRLDRTVELQMVSDVPFGAFLSGGLDSSMIVALMARHCPNVNTFSVGFGDQRYSELSYAAEVAREFGTTHHELTVLPDSMIGLLPKLIAFRDAPVSEPSDIAIYRLACEASKSVKMVLTGEGSDEIFGGYPKHVFERFASGFQTLPGALRHGLIAPLVDALPYGFRRAKTAIANLNIDDWQERYVRWFGALDYGERARLSVLGLDTKPGRSSPPFDADDDVSTLRRILYFDQTSWLPDNLLERGDRMSMAASIEARVPFLDHELGEFVSKLPDHYRVRGFRTKWILREAGKRLLPPAIVKRPKVGFRVPVNEWFRHEMRGFLLDHLQGPGSRTRAYFDPKVLDRTLDEHLKGRRNHEKLLWALLNLEIWQRTYV